MITLIADICKPENCTVGDGLVVLALCLGAIGVLWVLLR